MGAGRLYVRAAAMQRTHGCRAAGLAACGREQQHVVILVRNEDPSQLDQGNIWQSSYKKMRKTGPCHAILLLQERLASY